MCVLISYSVLVSWVLLYSGILICVLVVLGRLVSLVW